MCVAATFNTNGPTRRANITARALAPLMLLTVALSGCAADPSTLPIAPEVSMAPPGVNPRLQQLFDSETQYLINGGGPTSPNSVDGARRASMLFHEILVPHATDGHRPEVQDETLPPPIQYLLGRGAPQDAEKAIKLMEAAEAAGNLTWVCALAQMYDRGIQVAQNRRRALELYGKCLPKQPQLVTRIGEMHELGLGTDVDYARALHFYILGTTAYMSLTPSHFPFSWHQPWHSDAEYRIGRLYAQGKGVSRNYREAAGWFMRASEYEEKPGNRNYGEGSVGRARCALAIMYAEDLGVIKNISNAQYWLDKPGTKKVAACSDLVPHW